MSTATHVPQTSTLRRDELSADDATATLRRVGARVLVRDSFLRLRYGDGFSSARAMAYQFVLSFVPLVIAVVGLSSSIRAEKPAAALRATLLSLAPGTGGDAVKQALTSGAATNGSTGRVVLVLGLGTALAALATAMAQIERGANRLYGVQRDRPALHKYGRASLLMVTAGIPAMLGFLLLVAGGPAVDALQEAYPLPDVVVTAVQWLRWPVGALLDLAAITALFRWAPRRRQPTWSWLAFGAALSLLLWLGFTGLLALYVARSSSFGQVYGPLTGVFALLLWAQLTSISLLVGLAFAAQLEAVRAGVPSPVATDPQADERALTGSTVVLTPQPASP